MASKIPLEFQVQLPPGSCIIYVVQSFLAVHTDTLWLDGLLVIVAPTLKVPKEIAAIVSLRRGSLYMTNTQIFGLPEVGDTKNAVSRAVVVGADATNAYFHNVTVSNLTSGLSVIAIEAPSVFDSCSLGGSAVRDPLFPDAPTTPAPGVVLIMDTDVLVLNSTVTPRFSWNEFVARGSARVFVDGAAEVVAGDSAERQAADAADAGANLTGIATEFAALQEEAPWEVAAAVASPEAVSLPAAGHEIGGSSGAPAGTVIALCIVSALLLLVTGAACYLWRRRRSGRMRGLPEIEVTARRHSSSDHKRPDYGAPTSRGSSAMQAVRGAGSGDLSLICGPTSNAQLNNGRASTFTRAAQAEHPPMHHVQLSMHQDQPVRNQLVPANIHVVNFGQALDPPTFQSTNTKGGAGVSTTAAPAGVTAGPDPARLSAASADAGPDGAAEQATADDAGVPTPHVAAEPPPVHIQPQSKGQMDLLCTEICAWGALNSSAADELQHGLHGYTYTTNSPIPYLRGGQGVVLLFPTAAVRTRPGMQVKTTRAMKLFANHTTYGKEILHYQDPRFRDFMPRMLEYGYYDSAGQAVRGEGIDGEGAGTQHDVIQKDLHLWKTYPQACVLRRPYIVMEQGQCLRACANDDTTTLPTFSKMLLEVAKNLAGLHDNEVVHRDIKPDNLLRISQGAVTVWKIIDFGLACKIGETKSPGGFTLAFAAPEAVSARARVRSGETDLKVVVRPSLDAWSFGVTAFSVLSKFPEIFPPNESTLRSESVSADEMENMILGSNGRRLPWEGLPASTGETDRARSIKLLVLGLLDRNPDTRLSVKDFRDRLEAEIGGQ